MWITCGRQHEETPRESEDSQSHGSFSDLGGPLGRCRRDRRGRLEQRSRPPQGCPEAMPPNENGRLCGLRRCHSRISDVHDRTQRMWKIREDPNRIHQGEEGLVGTYMTITAAGRGVRREPPPNVRCAT